MLSMSPAPAVTVKAEKEIEPLVVSLATAAKLLGVSDRHLRTHTKEGTVPFVKLGGRILFRIKSLNRMLAESEQTASGDRSPNGSLLKDRRATRQSRVHEARKEHADKSEDDLAQD